MDGEAFSFVAEGNIKSNTNIIFKQEFDVCFCGEPVTLFAPAWHLFSVQRMNV